METFAQLLDSKNYKLISLGGNCIANMFCNIKSPFAGVNFENGILDIVNILNHYFFGCLYTPGRLYYRKNDMYEYDKTCLVNGFEFLHLDLTDETQLEKVRQRYNATFFHLEDMVKNGTKFVYSLSYYDSKYITEDDAEFIANKLKKVIPESQLIILESENKSTDNGENGFFQNARNPVFYKYFKNVFRIDFSQDPYLQFLNILEKI